MNGLPHILASYIRAKRLARFSSRDELLRWQDKQVRRLIARVRRRSPFYARHLAGYSPDRWRELPILDKAAMMSNFDDLNTVGVTKEQAFSVALRAEQSRDFRPTIGEVTVGLSSGTSGSRGIFLVTPEERHEWAGAVLAKVFPSLLAAQRVAFFLRANSNLYSTLGSGRIRFEFFDLIEPLEAHVARLNALLPTMLVAPPSLLRLLARERAEGRLLARPGKVISVAEVLDPVDEAYIAARFGGIVHQVYQCTEGFLGCTCSHGTLHLNEDIVAVQKEYLDRDLRKFVPIITDFRRTAQPIIRYRLNDILTERASPCPCGSVFTALESVEGRCDDLFYFEAAEGGRWIHVFPDFVRRAILTASEHVEEYIARQTGPDQVEIEIKVPEAHRQGAESAIETSMRRLFASSGCRVPEIRHVPPRAAPPLKKLRRVERLFTPESLNA